MPKYLFLPRKSTRRCTAFYLYWDVDKRSCNHFCMVLQLGSLAHWERPLPPPERSLLPPSQGESTWLRCEHKERREMTVIHDPLTFLSRWQLLSTTRGSWHFLALNKRIRGGGENDLLLYVRPVRPRSHGGQPEGRPRAVLPGIKGKYGCRLAPEAAPLTPAVGAHALSWTHSPFQRRHLRKLCTLINRPT